MARPVASDLYQNFRFHVIALEEAGKEELIKNINIVPGVPDAGFMNITMPEISFGIAEYRDGITTFTRKQPGIPSMNDLTLSRGLMKRDTGLFRWILKNATGEEYRIDLAILQFHREDIINPAEKRNPSRRIIIKNAFANRYKSSGDLDASSEEISIQEIDIVYESFYIVTADGSIGNDIL